MTRLRSSVCAVVAACFATLLAGCGAGIVPSTKAATTTTPPTAAPQITISPTSLSFASTSVGVTSAFQTITVGNIGNATLNFLGITLNDTTNYSMTNGCGATLAAGSSCTLSVTFHPTTTATPINSTILLADDTGNVGNSQQTVTLAGAVTAQATPVISISPTSLTFASTSVGATSAAQTVAVSNIGTAALTLNSITLGDTTNYGMTSTCGASLAAGASCALSVTFHPTATTALASSITFTDNTNGVNGSTQTVSLSGTGSATAAPIATLTPTSLTFADTTVGSTTAAQTITLSNTGNATLNITDISLGDLQDYTLTSTCGTTLAAGANCTLTVTFHPSATGSLGSAITLTDNSGNVTNAQQSVALSGNGLSAGIPVATFSPMSIVFPDTTVNTTSAALSLLLTNTGTANLVVSSIGTLSSAFTQTGYACSGGGQYSTIAPGASCTFMFTFSPTAMQAYTSPLVFTDNSGGVTGAMQSIAFSGNGISAANNAVTLTPNPLNFPDTTVGSTSSAVMATLFNGGTATLTGITPAIVATGTSKAFAITSTTCGGTLAAGASCTISLTFTPFAIGDYTGNQLTVTDSAGNSPQTITLSAKGVQASLTLSTTSFAFPTTTVGTTSAALTSILTNTGGATANLGAITYTGSTVFVTSNNCGATLAGGASCTITATFTPAAAVAYTGTINITSSNATPAALSIALTGSGTTSTVVYNLYELPDPGTGHAGTGLLAAVYGLIDNAKTTIDMTMYALNDNGTGGTTQKLVAACARGVKVRVILDQNSEKSQDTPAYTAINAQANCTAVWANKAFSVTHQKSIEVDGTTMALMSLNLQAQYYSTTRDYAMIYNDPVDIAAVEATFNMDFAAGTPASGVAGASDYSYIPNNGNDLIWSPTNAKQKMLDVINNATVSLNVEAEELTSTASYIVSAISAQCQKGLAVKVLIENEGGAYTTQLNQLKAAGCPVHVYTSSTGFYVHAKDVVADYGLPTQAAYMGSINYSNASMTANRELGMNISDQASVSLLYNTFNTDYAAAATF